MYLKYGLEFKQLSPDWEHIIKQEYLATEEKHQQTWVYL